MSLIKVIAYTLLGYVIYELYLGVTEGVEANNAKAAGPRSAKSNPRGRRTVSVAGQSGATSKRSVGRGVS
jgi:hypothetical protein